MKRGRILVVEADPLAAAAIRRCLPRYYVDLAACIGAGLGRLDLRTYDLLLLERRLPDGLGENLIVEARPRWPGLPIIMMSGQLDPPLRTRPPAARADDFIEKPLIVESLIEKIERLLAGRV